jgi:DNA repair protein RecO (recombination protein O)
MVPVSVDKAYILHLRPYTDSRVIVEFLTCQQGLVHAVARTPGKRDRAKFEAFQPVNVEFMGMSELKTLRYCEQMAESIASLTGTSLFCGLYLNELLQRLLSPGEPFTDLFYYYETTLQRLQNGAALTDLESTLRKMEFFLLAQLGFAMDFSTCYTTGSSVKSDRSYRYVVGEGFSEAADTGSSHLREICIPGAHLLAIAEGELKDPGVLRTAKAISRKALAPLLHGKPLKSRELFS